MGWDSDHDRDKSVLVSCLDLLLYQGGQGVFSSVVLDFPAALSESVTTQLRCSRCANTWRMVASSVSSVDTKSDTLMCLRAASSGMEVVPGLGDGFVRECFQHRDWVAVFCTSQLGESDLDRH